MEIFISWSGSASRAAAKIITDWLPNVIHWVRPWFSSVDIATGERWSEALSNALERVSFGIICLTQENLVNSWIMFEAGALSKSQTLGISRVCPLLIGLKKNEIIGPLSQFQMIQFDHDEVLKLIKDINVLSVVEPKITERKLEEQFRVWWPELKSRIEQITSFEKIPRLSFEDKLEIEELLHSCNTASIHTIFDKRILIIDDEKPYADRLEHVLKKQGFTSVETLNQVERFSDLNSGYDLAIVDIYMLPYDGFQVKDYLKMVSPDTKVLLISSRDNFSVDLLSKASRADGWFKKGDDDFSFIMLVNRLLQPSSMTNGDSSLCYEIHINLSAINEWGLTTSNQIGIESLSKALKNAIFSSWSPRKHDMLFSLHQLLIELSKRRKNTNVIWLLMDDLYSYCKHISNADIILRALGDMIRCMHE